MRISRSGAPPRAGRRSEQGTWAPGQLYAIMASQPAECASGDVYSWEYAGSEEHAAGMQRAVRDDIIYDKHTGLCMTTSLHQSSDLPNLTAAQQHTHTRSPAVGSSNALYLVFVLCTRDSATYADAATYAGLGNVRGTRHPTYAGLGNVRGTRNCTRGHSL